MHQSTQRTSSKVETAAANVEAPQVGCLSGPEVSALLDCHRDWETAVS